MVFPSPYRTKRPAYTFFGKTPILIIDAKGLKNNHQFPVFVAVIFYQLLG